MKLSAIVALASNRVIGAHNQLPWRLPADLARFKRLTMGHTLIMGRKTYDSIGRPLPGRAFIVVTRQQDFAPDGVTVAHSVEQALQQARARGDDEVFIAGGADLYAQTMDRVQRLYLTRIARDYPGDILFPEVDLSGWRLVEEEQHPESEPPYAFLTYER
ncbi:MULTISPECIES: dihydrofolate reductase [Myxococcus]|uniref:Dihydrofolate reductase n=1 Tax=Myxococcus llanfairpwllgwyngyllgogerychwyrndrobwllllantysiliogogogochensis TaxID=2590453 RepID=A0A540WRD1_9BACT|nr:MULTISPECIES: dihydrofolate reductase [Myxococcus]NTX00373.1 dihydrofolate reductase [Myxococcus sp. CA040A]NTX33941.1 dihydrofolate reductase [Myxococcus sp. CA033]NTX57625.1 dihydrofolate reductase [Myxococcus sp. CA039A]TQF11582.1 dihydrofolate reductase [Myxococcus llanfairpwllgwyngyllgogerychwyrndrobwllllantysiliogogogochensis]